MRRPVVVIVCVTAVLLVVAAAPFVHLKLGYLDDRVLSPSDQIRQVDDTLRTDFGQGQTDALAGRGATHGCRRPERSRLRTPPGSPSSPTSSASMPPGVDFRGVRLPAPPPTWPSSPATAAPGTRWSRKATRALRGRAPSWCRPSATIRHRSRPRGRAPGRPGRLHRGHQPVPAAGAAPRGRGDVPAVALPLPQRLHPDQGAGPQRAQPRSDVRDHGLDLPGRPPVRPSRFHSDWALVDTMPILMFCVAFGLSMDYEVFLVSRMKERRDAARPTKRPSRAGCSRPAASSRRRRC